MNGELEREIRENYRKLDPDRLIEIARNFGEEYTGRAVEMAKEELAERGIREIPPPPEAEPEPAPPPEPEPDPPPEAEPDLARFGVLREYADEGKAGDALLWLAAENLRAVLTQVEGDGVRPVFRLAVPEDEKAPAEEILREFEAEGAG